MKDTTEAAKISGRHVPKSARRARTFFSISTGNHLRRTGAGKLIGTTVAKKGKETHESRARGLTQRTMFISHTSSV